MPEGARLDIVLVDDGSPDGTDEVVRETFPTVDILERDGSLFWCGGMRMVWEHAAKAYPDFYLFVNDDSMVELEALVELLKIVARFGIDLGPKITLLPPMAYMDFLNLWKDARMVLTDSGGLQEKTTALGVPCITLREDTERPITIEERTHVLAGIDPTAILAATSEMLEGRARNSKRPTLWDGKAADRIVEMITCYLREMK